MSLPTDDVARKSIRIWQGFIKYFPDATAAVAQLSKICNEQHNSGEPMHWAKEKSTEELDSLMNHMIDLTTDGLESRDVEGVLHATKLAWRGMANLQRLADSGVDIFAHGDMAASENVPEPEACGHSWIEAGWDSNDDRLWLCEFCSARSVETAIGEGTLIEEEADAIQA